MKYSQHEKVISPVGALGSEYGKVDAVTHLCNVLVFALRKLSHSALSARAQGIIVPETDRFTVEALSATLGQVTLNPLAIENLIEQSIFNRKKFAQLRGCKIDNTQRPTEEIEAMKLQPLNLESFIDNEDSCAIAQVLLYGLKGSAEYIHRAAALGKEDPLLYAFIYEGLAAGFPNREGKFDKELTVEDWLDLVVRCGKINMRAMELVSTVGSEM